jgi:hypothetical protein
MSLQTRHPKCIVAPQDSFRGSAYSDWVGKWSNWLVSEDPDYDGNDTLFLRGYIDYGPSISGAAPQLYDRSLDNGFTITKGTAIFIPVVTATFVIGDRYLGSRIESEQMMRYAARTDIAQGGEMWATLSEKGSADTPIVPQLDKYLVESNRFVLSVSDRSPLKDKLEVPLKAGAYEAITAGYFLLIDTEELPSSTYRIKMGGRGRGTYRTAAVYDISVHDKPKSLVKDVSNTVANMSVFQAIKPL